MKKHRRKYQFTFTYSKRNINHSVGVRVTKNKKIYLDFLYDVYNVKLRIVKDDSIELLDDFAGWAPAVSQLSNAFLAAYGVWLIENCLLGAVELQIDNILLGTQDGKVDQS